MVALLDLKPSTHLTTKSRNTCILTSLMMSRDIFSLFGTVEIQKMLPFEMGDTIQMLRIAIMSVRVARQVAG